MSEAARSGSAFSLVLERQKLRFWKMGAVAAASWGLAAVVTEAWPDVADWDNTDTWAWIALGLAVLLLVLTPIQHRLGRAGRTLGIAGPWFVALGVFAVVWELTTAKLGWLPRPFFAPPQGLVDAYAEDWPRLLICAAYSLRLFACGFIAGGVSGFILGVLLGWSPAVNYWGQPILKLIGPVPATAWLPIIFFVFPTAFGASIFLVALATGIPVAILTWSGVKSVANAYYDVARTLGASNRFLIFKVAIPAALPHVFVGLFMGLYSSFAVLVVAEMMGAKAGLGWYLQWATGYSAYGNMYAALLLMALICSGLVKFLFLARDRLLSWQKGLVAW
jgi:NitT/TauT family transport system permease protein